MTQRTMVLKILTSLLVFLPFLTGQPMPPEECCMEKKVGDFEYMFVKEGLPGMVPASCINMCIYKRVDTGKMYCFAPGDLHVDCEDDAADGIGCICPVALSPVCGENENTYVNSCQADCNGVEILYQG